MLNTAEKPGPSAEVIVMNVSELPISPKDEFVIACMAARRTAAALDVHRLTDVFIAGITEANNDLLTDYSRGLFSLRKKLAGAACFTDARMVERMINRVHERFLNDSRQSIVSRFSSVFIENCRNPVSISDDQWLAARRHCLGYDTSAVIEKISEMLNPGKSRENLLAIFANATLNKADGVMALREAITRVAFSHDAEDVNDMRQRIADINREKAEHAYIRRAREAQTASIEKEGILRTVWDDMMIHHNSGLTVEQNRIDSGDTNFTPPQSGTRLGNIFRP